MINSATIIIDNHTNVCRLNFIWSKSINSSPALLDDLVVDITWPLAKILGALVGTVVGSADGFTVGRRVVGLEVIGESVGSDIGEIEGIVDGWIVGVWVIGDNEGSSDGLVVGSVDGLSEGCCVGLSDPEQVSMQSQYAVLNEKIQNNPLFTRSANQPILAQNCTYLGYCHRKSTNCHRSHTDSLSMECDKHQLIDERVQSVYVHTVTCADTDHVSIGKIGSIYFTLRTAAYPSNVQRGIKYQIVDKEKHR